MIINFVILALLAVAWMFFLENQEQIVDYFWEVYGIEIKIPEWMKVYSEEEKKTVKKYNSVWK